MHPTNQFETWMLWWYNKYWNKIQTDESDKCKSSKSNITDEYCFYRHNFWAKRTPLLEVFEGKKNEIIVVVKNNSNTKIYHRILAEIKKGNEWIEADNDIATENVWVSLISPLEMHKSLVVKYSVVEIKKYFLIVMK